MKLTGDCCVENELKCPGIHGVCSSLLRQKSCGYLYCTFCLALSTFVTFSPNSLRPLSAMQFLFLNIKAFDSIVELQLHCLLLRAPSRLWKRSVRHAGLRPHGPRGKDESRRLKLEVIFRTGVAVTVAVGALVLQKQDSTPLRSTSELCHFSYQPSWSLRCFPWCDCRKRNDTIFRALGRLKGTSVVSKKLRESR